VQPVRRYHWNTPEYADAFDVLLRSTRERAFLHQLLTSTLSRYPPEAHAVDWGAGRGDLTALMLQHFRHVYAVEPSPTMRAELEKRCPEACILAGTILSTSLPTPVEVSVLSHVLYHVPDHKWGAYVLRAASHLSRDGVLLVIQSDPDSEANWMLEHFGAPRFDLYAALATVIRRHKEYDFTFTRGRGPLRTTSFEETLQVARFVLCDRDEDAFSRPPIEEGFQSYVREHFWDERTATGGWQHDIICCTIRRNTEFTEER
jgi:SAM-dependent methyltransferase